MAWACTWCWSIVNKNQQVLVITKENFREVGVSPSVVLVCMKSAKPAIEQSYHTREIRRFYVVRQNHLCPRQESNDSYQDSFQSLWLQITSIYKPTMLASKKSSVQWPKYPWFWIWSLASPMDQSGQTGIQDINPTPSLIISFIASSLWDTFFIIP